MPVPFRSTTSLLNKVCIGPLCGFPKCWTTFLQSSLNILSVIPIAMLPCIFQVDSHHNKDCYLYPRNKNPQNNYHKQQWPHYHKWALESLAPYLPFWGSQDRCCRRPSFFPELACSVRKVWALMTLRKCFPCRPLWF